MNPGNTCEPLCAPRLPSCSCHLPYASSYRTCRPLACQEMTITQTAPQTFHSMTKNCPIVNSDTFSHNSWLCHIGPPHSLLDTTCVFSPPLSSFCLESPPTPFLCVSKYGLFFKDHLSTHMFLPGFPISRLEKSALLRNSVCNNYNTYSSLPQSPGSHFFISIISLGNA